MYLKKVNFAFPTMVHVKQHSARAGANQILVNGGVRTLPESPVEHEQSSPGKSKKKSESGHYTQGDTITRGHQ